MLQNLVRLYEMVESMSGVEFKAERLMAFVGMEEEKKPKKQKRWKRNLEVQQGDCDRGSVAFLLLPLPFEKIAFVQHGPRCFP